MYVVGSMAGVTVAVLGAFYKCLKINEHRSGVPSTGFKNFLEMFEYWIFSFANEMKKTCLVELLSRLKGIK